MDETSKTYYQLDNAEKISKKYIRLKKVEMTNFRNMEYGRVDLPNSNLDEIKSGNPSILGLYGQNGSGKTSLVIALGLLKTALIGLDINKCGYKGIIKNGCDSATLSYEFVFYSESIGNVEINYSFQLIVHTAFDSDPDGDDIEWEELKIVNEKLSYKGTNALGESIPKFTAFDTTPGASKKGYSFGKDSSYEKLIGKDKELKQKLLELKAVSFNDSGSFIFYPNTRDIFINSINKDSVARKIYLNLLQYGRYFLHIIDNDSTAITNMNERIPLFMWSRDESRSVKSGIANLNIRDSGYTTVSESSCIFFNETFDAMNMVLCKLIPGLKLELEDAGTAVSKTGRNIHRYKILSNRNGITVPINCESDGIRRIVSIIIMLIGVYNQSSITVVIDEVDSGIYEYLLGELLKILSKSGRGQFIFTSHNLRPLEVLPSKYICFTTTNAEKRYVKLVTSGNNNLRDLYYKKIVLGSDDERLYDSTDDYEIEQAFYEAGRVQDKTL